MAVYCAAGSARVNLGRPLPIIYKKGGVRLTEEWRVIEDFPNYEVSNFGRIRNRSSGQILKPGLGGVGYFTVSLYKNKKPVTNNIHQLVADAFLGKKSKGMTVNHIDGNKRNNHVSNLEIIAYRDNIRHAYENGLNTHNKAVKIIETGEIFNSQIECAKAIDGDASDISYCLSGKLKSHKGFHFERVDKPKKPFLYDHQRDAIKKMKNGCILNGGVGSGKSRTGIYYYFSQYGGYIDSDSYIPMKNPPDLYIITTARKRDTNDWVGELAPFLISPNPDASNYKNNVVIDSWNNIKKYADVKNSFFIFDEDRVTGYGAWVKAFLKIVKSNKWILLSATPGDVYMDYLPVFLANGFYKNKTEFSREHVVYSRFSKFPKVDRYVNTGKLDKLRRSILVDMDFERPTIPHHEDVYVKYDVSKYKDVSRLRWNPYKNEPIINAAELCYVWRKIVNSDESRQRAVLELFEDHPRVIIFYSFDYEREILLNLYYGDDVEVAEWSGHAHQPIPDSDRWVYLVNYSAGSEGFNCIKTDTIIFYSQNYSYKTMVQAAGRIDRLNTPYKDLYYYHLKSRSGIDLAISRALHEKRKFNETKYVKW